MTGAIKSRRIRWVEQLAHIAEEKRGYNCTWKTFKVKRDLGRPRR